MANFRPILPKPDSETHRINILFSKLQEQLLHEGFVSNEVKGKDLRWLIVYSETDIVDAESGPSQAARILIDKDGNFQFQVFLVTLAKGKVNDASFKEHLLQMKAGSDFKVCPGIQEQYFEIKDEIRRKSRIPECGQEIKERTAQIVSSGLIQIAWRGDMVNMHAAHVNYF